MKRFFIFWLALAAAFASAAELLPLELRQVIIRAPEMEVISWAIDPTVTDARLSELLWQAVREGRARVVSDVAGGADDTKRVALSAGHQVWVPNLIDQDFDRLYMTPVGYQECLVGTLIECEPQVFADSKAAVGIRAGWHSRYTPRGPMAVQWPSSWLNIYEGDKTTDKLIHGWLDWHDLFEESVMGDISFHPGAPTLIAILPPADQLWPGADGEKKRHLDVFIGQMGRPGVDAPPSLSPRTLLLGIALPSTAALEVMASRQPADDAAILTSLLEEVRAGGARMIFTAGSSKDPLSGSRASLISARRHAYPTEMPSIPSAWGERPVGTSWESDMNLVALRQDLAPPARTEWRLAEDVPGAIMWEPRFRGIEIQAMHGIGSGAYLLSLLRIPDVMRGPGLEGDESVFIFAKHHAPPRKPATDPITNDPFGPGGGGFTPPAEYEAEVWGFEVPAKEAEDWKPAAFANARDSDQTRLKNLLGRVDAGTAALTAHLLLRTPAGNLGTCRIVEEYQTAVEYDPPHLPGSPRMRPTALVSLPVGTRWKIDLSDPEPDDGLVSVEHTFEHSTAKPVEPPLAETLAIAVRDETSGYPGAIHHEEVWKGKVTLPLGQPVCLGTQKPPGVSKKVLHVAFMRLRKL